MTRFSAGLVVIAMVFAALAIAGRDAYAITRCDYSGTGADDGVVIGGICERASDGGSENGTRAGHEPPTPPQRTIICARPAGSGGPPITSCIAPPACPDGVAYQSEILRNGRWSPIGAPWCPEGGAAPPPARPPTPTLAQIRDQALRLLPHVSIGSAPEGAGLANAETVLWADTGTDRRLPAVTIVGQQVELRISFDHANWTFGDGASDTTNSPGRPYDAHSDPCETAQCADYYGHTYKATGQVTVTLTVTWHAQYRLAGQGWTDVRAAPLAGPAGTQSLIIRQARGVLVH